MDANVTLTVGYYHDREAAKFIADALESMHRNLTIQLIDLATLRKSDQGKLKIEETRELTGRKGARRGAVILGIFGLIYPPSFIASALLGGGIGALTGRIRDTGIKKDQMQRVAEQLGPGMTAVVVLTDLEWQKLVVDTLDTLDGHVETYDLGPETSADVTSLAEETAMSAEAES